MNTHQSDHEVESLFDGKRWRQFGLAFLGLFLLKGLVWLALGYFAFR
jgi:hypothetical protein